MTSFAACGTFSTTRIDAGRHERIRVHLELCDPCRDQYTFEGSFLRSVGGLLDDDSDMRSLRSRIETALLEHGFPRRE
jgi:hypothetical protein